MGGGWVFFSKVVATFSHMDRSFNLFMATTRDVWIIPSFQIWGYVLHVEHISCVITNCDQHHVFDVQAVITRLIWTIWTLLSDVQERLLNCIIHSLILVLHICISESGQHWFRQWLGAWSAPNHYLNQCWILLIGPLGINFSEMAIEINTFWLKKCTWNVFCELAAILSKGDELIT